MPTSSLKTTHREAFLEEACVENDLWTVYDQFANQVALTPEAVAIRFENRSMTYSQLAQRVNTIALALARAGVVRNSLVAVHLERNIDMVACTLATLKLGAGFVPLDPTLPDERKQYIINHAQPVVCISETIIQTATNEPLTVNSEDLVSQRYVKPSEIDAYADSEASFQSERGEIAYVIYTSGSTGQPKGVAVSHASLQYFFHSFSQVLELGAQDTFVALTTFGFDISLLELLLPLTIGGTCHLVSSSVAKQPEMLRALLDEVRPTVLQATPSTFDMLLDEGWLPSPETNIVCGGEAWSPELFYKLTQAANVWNAYGPTEATIWTSLTRIDKQRDLSACSSLPISKYFPGATLVVLNNQMQPVSVGEVGELYIGGPGLALGYYRNNELTEEKFAPLSIDGKPEARFYRSGDVVRVLNQDEFHYVGRTDHQLKLRGHRMEAGDIEHHLLVHPLVDRCVVGLHDNEGQKYLVAWYTDKNPAGEIESDHTVQDWGDIYDHAYRESEQASLDFDTSGWNSIYTEQPIPEPEMRRWVDRTVTRIEALAPKKALEIGCGTGLIMYPLLEKNVDYTGIDLSASAVERHQQHINAKHLTNCRVIQSSADQISDLPHEESHGFDTIIINSVAQYFPQKTYLDNVLRDCLVKVEQGQVFIGDVIDLRLQDAYYSSVILSKNSQRARASVMREVALKKQWENELHIDPEYFLNFAHQHSQITGVALMPKLLDDSNELCRYRYDVVLYVGSECRSLPDNDSIQWSAEFDIKQCLERGEDTIVVHGYPRKNILSDYEFLINASQEETQSHHVLSATELEAIARQYGYQLQAYLDLGSAEQAFKMALCFTRSISKPYAVASQTTAKVTTNSPYSMAKTSMITEEELRSYSRDVLPAYMVPDVFMHMTQFPLTANGKIDRNSLPAPTFHRHTILQDDTESGLKGDIESKLASIWQKILSLSSEISRYDHFFKLGGHSLGAIRVASEIKKTFGVSLQVCDLLQANTLEQQAELIEAKR